MSLTRLAHCLTICSLACVAAWTGTAAASQQLSGGLFPSPFLVEHVVVTTEPDGASFASDPVIDHYGGSMIVSVREDGSRLVVDFARRELTEIRPSSGTYTVITFDRLAQLTRKLRRIEGPPIAEPEPDGASNEVRLDVRELETTGATKVATAALAAASPLLDRPGLRRFEVTVEIAGEASSEPAIEAWLNPEHQLVPAALDAVEDFELHVLGAATDPDALIPLKALAATRRHADGAVPIATARPTRTGDGRIEDVALRVEALDAFPVDLVAIPEGLKRTTHPLEIMVAHAEQEAELRRLMDAPADQGGAP